MLEIYSNSLYEEVGLMIMAVYTAIKCRNISKKFGVAWSSGLVIGFMIAYLLSLTSTVWYSESNSSSKMKGVTNQFHNLGNHNKNENFHYTKNSIVADQLSQQVRILCWVLTAPQYHESRAKHVKNTWGKRCNILLFMSTEYDDELPTVVLSVSEGYDKLWGKTKAALSYIYKLYRNKADWFLKVDDDTYIILENLRYMLLPYSTAEPIYFGCRFKSSVKQGDMHGGAGYVLSQEALQRLVKDALPNATICTPGEDGFEDVEVGRCLAGVFVKAVDSRDSLGRNRFLPFAPKRHLIPDNLPGWYWKYIYYEDKDGMECCSDNAVSFHRISANHMKLDILKDKKAVKE